MSLIKRAACKVLKDYLATQPGLTTVPIHVQGEDYEDDETQPSITIIPGRCEFTPWQDEEADITVDDKILCNVGDFEGSAEIRAVCNFPAQREVLEQCILDAFMSSEFSQGVITGQTPPLTVGGQAYLARAICTFVLKDEDWRDEMVFSSQRYSYLAMDMSFPAFASRTAYTIEQLILAIAFDLASNDPDEARQINQDGSTTSV